MQLKFISLAILGLTALSGCTDDASLCREPGYSCADHVSAKDNVCTIPGYTCTPSDDEETTSPITGKHKGSDAGDGGDL